MSMILFCLQLVYLYLRELDILLNNRMTVIMIDIFFFVLIVIVAMTRARAVMMMSRTSSSTDMRMKMLMRSLMQCKAHHNVHKDAHNRCQYHDPGIKFLRRAKEPLNCFM